MKKQEIELETHHFIQFIFRKNRVLIFPKYKLNEKIGNRVGNMPFY